MASTPLRVVLLGPPASGKGTQGRLLAADRALPYLSTGALLREQMQEGTALGKQAEPILARGGYLSDALMCPIIADWLSRHEGGWVLDGFPRSLIQAKFLNDTLSSHGLKLDAAVSLRAPFPDLLARIADRVECPECRWSGRRDPQISAGDCPVCGHLTAGRADDDVRNFRNRYDAFERQVLPVIEYYRLTGRLVAADATSAPDEVFARLTSSLSVDSV